MLQSQLVQVPFAQGLDQKTDPRHVVAGRLLDARNVRFRQNGSVEKRLGTTQLAEVANGVRLIARGDELSVVQSDGAVQSYSEHTGDMVSRGQGLSHACSRFPLASAGDVGALADVAYGAGLYCVAWLAFTDGVAAVWVVLIDAETGGEVLSASYPAPAFGGPRVCFVASAFTTGAFMLVYPDGVNTNIYARSIDVATLTISSPSTVISACRIGSPIEVAAYGSLSWLLLFEDSATSKPHLYLFTGFSPTSSVRLNHATAGDKYGFGLSAVEGENIWCSFIRDDVDDEAFVSCVDPSGFAERAGFPLSVYQTSSGGSGESLDGSAVCRLSSTAAVVGVNGQWPMTTPAFKAPYALAPVVDSSGAIVGNASAAARRTYWATFASEPFVTLAGRCHAWFVLHPAWTTSTTTYSDPASYQLVDLGTEQTTAGSVLAAPASLPVCARSALPLGGGGDISSAAMLGSGVHVAVGQLRNPGVARGALVGLRSDATDANRFLGATIGGVAYYTPGGAYDGRYVWEMAFSNGPLRIHVEMTGAASGNLPAGSYAWLAVPTIRDRNGNVYRGTPSLPVAATAAANDLAVVRVPPVTVLNRQNGDESTAAVEIELYRTLVGGSTDGPFFRVGDGSSGSNPNDPTLSVQAINDDATDASIQNNPQPYTAGGVLENVCPPALRMLLTYRERLVGVGDDGRTLWFSKAFVEGEAIGWSDEFTIQWSEAEEITALAAVDEKLVAFTRSGVFVNVFVGPADVGGLSDVGPWTRLQADAGCIDQRSVVSAGPGVFFQAAAGIYLLTRGLEAQFIGQPVADLLESYPTITGASLHAAETSVLFAATDGTYGVRLVYDYRVGQWTHDEVRGSSAAGAGAYLVDETLVGGRLCTLTPTVLLRESADYLDDPGGEGDGWIFMAVESSNLAVGGLQGFQRARRLALMGERFTSADLTVEIANDYADTYHQARTWEAVTLDALVLSETQIHLARQKCTAVRVRISDSAPTGGSVGSGRGYSLNGLLIEVGVKRGAAKVADPQKG
jgi:hypothetical protein